MNAAPATQEVGDKPPLWAGRYSIGDIARLTDEQAMLLVRKARWPETHGEPVCPQCGCVAVYEYKTRRIFKCQGCGHQFSITSGTIFASRKLPVRDILLAIGLFVSAKKGISSLQLSRDLAITQAAAWKALHKIRAHLVEHQKHLRLTGEVEIDGATFGGYVKQANKVRDGHRYRMFVQKYTHRRVVVVARQRGGRTLTFIVKTESEAVFQLNARVDKSASIFVDGAHAWDSMERLFQLLRIQHKYAFWSPNACTNNAESYFSQLRRAFIGTHHRMSAQWLSHYAAEMAWRIDHNKLSAVQQWEALLSTCLTPALPSTPQTSSVPVSTFSVEAA